MEIWRSTASYKGRRPLSLISASPTPMRRRTGINLHGRSLRKLQSARRISTWRPAESVGGISSPWLIQWTAWPERRREPLKSGSRRSSPANGTVPTARWRASSRLGCPFPSCDRSPCFCVAAGPRPGSAGPPTMASQPVPPSPLRGGRGAPPRSR